MNQLSILQMVATEAANAEMARKGPKEIALLKVIGAWNPTSDMLDLINGFRDEVIASVKASQWIAVEDDLPIPKQQFDHHVMLYYIEGQPVVSVGYHIGNNHWFDSLHNRPTLEGDTAPTHWQPLPQATNSGDVPDNR